MRPSRGRLTKPPEKNLVKLEFGLHQVCPWCKGKGRRVGKKELCGGCGGTGVYARPQKESTDEGE